MFKVYISDSVYDRIISTEEQRAITVRSKLYKLLKQQPVQKLKETDLENYKANPKNVLKDSSALYIFDISSLEALDIQKRYGVMCLSSENPDISPLIDVNDYFKTSVTKKKFKGWDRVLDSVEKLPSNALLLIDRYLFSARNKDKGDGLINVRHILNELLPKEFEGPDYHITIVFNIEVKHHSYSFIEIASKLYNIAHQLRTGFNLMIEVFGIKENCSLYDDSHDRQIVSNYYLVEASHKLAAFNPEDMGTVSQSIIPWSLFTEDSLNGKSSAPLDSINQTIESFRKFYAALSDEAEHNTYLYAVNGKLMERCMGIRNRLFK